MLKFLILFLFTQDTYALNSSNFLRPDLESANLNADSKTTNIEIFLEQITKNSTIIKNAQLEFASAKLLNEIELSEFDWSAFVNVSRLSAKDPQRNPFSPTQNEVNSLGLGVAKKWQYGIQTNLNYNVTDNLIQFPSDRLDYYFPDLSFEIKANLMDDIIYQQSLNKVLKIKQQNKSLELEKKIKVRQNLVESLLDLVNIVEIKNEVQLEKQICSEIKKQNTMLVKKRARGSISRRDALTSQKELNNCEINIKTLSNQLLAREKSLESKYNLNPVSYDAFEIESLFLEVKQIYKRFSDLEKNINFEQTIELETLKQQLQVLKAEGQQLKALNQTDVALEARYGLRGLNENLSDSQANIANSDFQNYYLGLRINLPFKDRTAESLMASNSYKKDIVGVNYQQTLKQKQAQFFVLKETLDENLLIYEKLEENYTLSRQILDEGLKDFNNGRIDFFNLTELRKAFLISQSQMIRLRSQILVNIVEYIDYYNYFERYY